MVQQETGAQGTGKGNLLLFSWKTFLTQARQSPSVCCSLLQLVVAKLIANPSQQSFQRLCHKNHLLLQHRLINPETPDCSPRLRLVRSYQLYRLLYLFDRVVGDSIFGILDLVFHGYLCYSGADYYAILGNLEVNFFKLFHLCPLTEVNFS